MLLTREGDSGTDGLVPFSLYILAQKRGVDDGRKHVISVVGRFVLGSTTESRDPPAPIPLSMF